MPERADVAAPGRSPKSVRLPWYVLALLGLGLGLLFVQGLRMARDRQARLLPARAETILDLSHPDQETAVRLGPESRFLGIDLTGQVESRLGLVQVFPERTLVRWIEAHDDLEGGVLVVPLEGLQPGRYLLTRESQTASAGPREMDLPLETLDVLARFRLEPPAR